MCGIPSCCMSTSRSCPSASCAEAGGVRRDRRQAGPCPLPGRESQRARPPENPGPARVHPAGRGDCAICWPAAHRPAEILDSRPGAREAEYRVLPGGRDESAGDSALMPALLLGCGLILAGGHRPAGSSPHGPGLANRLHASLLVAGCAAGPEPRDRCAPRRPACSWSRFLARSRVARGPSASIALGLVSPRRCSGWGPAPGVFGIGYLSARAAIAASRPLARALRPAARGAGRRGDRPGRGALPGGVGGHGGQWLPADHVRA